MWKLLLIPLLLYLAVVAALWLFQGRLVFPAGMVEGQAVPLPPGSERLVVETPDGERLHGVRIPASQSTPPGERPLILGFGGNAWNGDAVAVTLAGLFPDHDVAAFHYRGYRPSSGTPGARAILADALLIHDELARRTGAPRIVAVGFSLGTGVAARLAAERPIAGAILVTPYDSLAAVAAQHYPWIPVRLLFRHEMPAALDLARTRTPVAIVAAERDALILPERTEALRRRAANLVFHRIIPNADHNDIYEREDFRAAMREALARFGEAQESR
jgi:pimeloyl-ACP methyl ester carboxylesterase